MARGPAPFFRAGNFSAPLSPALRRLSQRQPSNRSKLQRCLLSNASETVAWLLSSCKEQGRFRWLCVMQETVSAQQVQSSCPPLAYSGKYPLSLALCGAGSVLGMRVLRIAVLHSLASKGKYPLTLALCGERVASLKTPLTPGHHPGLIKPG